MTPAYPKLKQSYIDGVYVTKMKLFNRRKEIEYYSIQVFTHDWKPLPFASTSRIINIGFNKRKLFEVFVSNFNYIRSIYLVGVYVTNLKWSIDI